MHGLFVGHGGAVVGGVDVDVLGGDRDIADGAQDIAAGLGVMRCRREQDIAADIADQ